MHMATNKKRLNVTLSTRAEEAISALAKQDGVPEATKAAELLERAIEMEEDLFWQKIVSERLEDKVTYLTHEEVWGEPLR